MAINSKTSLKAIKEMVLDDFGIVIDNSFAKIIKHANARMWNDRFLRVWDNGYQLEINASGVRDGGAYNSKREWNESMRNR